MVHTVNLCPYLQGVSAVRLFPLSGHILLSCSMDCKIKVSYFSVFMYMFYTILEHRQCNLGYINVWYFYQIPFVCVAFILLT